MSGVEGGRQVRVALIGSGRMGSFHAESLTHRIPGAELVAVADPAPGAAARMAATFGAVSAYTDAAEVFADPRVDAVVIAAPARFHADLIIAAAQAGKAVFCEKPLAVNADDAFAMAEAAEQAGVVNMVNLTYRNAHAIQMARRLIEDGEIGTIRHVEASYLQSWLTGRHWGDWRVDERWLWRLSTAHGSGGVLGDIGIHILDFVTFGTGLDVAALSARLKTFDKAEGGAIGEYRLDANDSCAMTVELSNGALGVVHMSRAATGKANDLDLTIHGETGALKIWSTTDDSTLDVCLGPDIETQTWKRVECPPTPRNADRFVLALLSGVNGQPDFRHAANVQRLLDLCIVSDAERRMLTVA